MRASLPASLALALPFVIAVCLGCSQDNGPAVPFKLTPPDQGATPEPTSEPSEPSEPSATNVPSVNARPGQSHPPGTTQITMGGQSIAIAGASIVASLATDVSRDGTDDTLLLTIGAAGALVLHQLGDNDLQRRSQHTLDNLAPGCSVQAARLLQVSDRHLVAGIDQACPSALGIREKEPPPAPELTQRDWLLTVEANPRVLERVALHPPSEQADVASLSLQWSGPDLDSDGNPDVLATIAVTGAGMTETSVGLGFLDRAGGLDRDRKQPEQTIAALVKAAKTASRAARPGLLQQALAIQRVLCAESGAARLSIGGVIGLRCGPSRSAGEAWIARMGDITDPFEAVGALDHLTSPAFTVSAADETRARDAVIALSRATRWSWTPGPTIDPPSNTPVRMPAVGFVDSDSLLLRGSVPRTLNTQTMELQELQPTGSTLALTNHNGSLTVAAIEQHCDGHHLRIVRSDQLVRGIVVGPALSEPLFAPARAATHASCASNPRFRTNDTGGYLALGWAPKGIVLARHDGLRFLPLDDQGQPLGAASALETNAPLPAPLPPGAAAVDGSAYVVSSPVGLLVRRFTPQPQSLLVQPAGPVSAADIAINPNGTRIAYVFGNQVFVGYDNAVHTAPVATPAPTAPSTPALAPAPASP